MFFRFLLCCRILSNPEVLRHLQTLQQQMSTRKTDPAQDEMEEKMRRLQEMRHQEEEFDKHLAQTLPVSILKQLCCNCMVPIMHIEIASNKPSSKY